jgi:hypothetical protein
MKSERIQVWQFQADDVFRTTVPIADPFERSVSGGPWHSLSGGMRIQWMPAFES